MLLLFAFSSSNSSGDYWYSGCLEANGCDVTQVSEPIAAGEYSVSDYKMITVQPKDNLGFTPASVTLDIKNNSLTLQSEGYTQLYIHAIDKNTGKPSSEPEAILGRGDKYVLKPNTKFQLVTEFTAYFTLTISTDYAYWYGGCLKANGCDVTQVSEPIAAGEHTVGDYEMITVQPIDNLGFTPASVTVDIRNNNLILQSEGYTQLYIHAIDKNTGKPSSEPEAILGRGKTYVLKANTSYQLVTEFTAYFTLKKSTEQNTTQ
jgi:multisubunit Na+/H+ antiporter MnhE subunit